MKINKNLNTPIEYTNLSAKNTSDLNKKNEKIKDIDKKNVKISESAKKLVKKISEKEEEGFSKKVEDIREKLSRGEYRVSSDDLAKKILEHIEEQKDCE